MRCSSRIQVAGRDAGTISKVIESRVQDLFNGSDLHGALQIDIPADPIEELTRLARELFDFFAQYHPVIEVMEKSVLDYPNLEETLENLRQRTIFDPWIAFISKRQAQGIFWRGWPRWCPGHG